ncbi:MAG: hypothetical protein IJ567_09110 [Lachnospiraceae bacterium]|nr:hypothetical protein [Lachnospiraceae bacterium]
MRKLAVAVCDPDGVYGEKLCEYLMQTGRLSDIRCYQQITSSMKEEKRDLWMVHADLWTDWQENMSGNQEAVCLTEEVVSLQAEPVKKIYKYQSADLILQQMYESLTKAPLPGQTSGKTRGRLIVLYHPWYQGISLMAGVAVAADLSRLGRVLYINGRGYHGMPISQGERTGKNIADVISAKRLGTKNMEMRLLSAIISTDEVDYIRPAAISAQMEGAQSGDYMGLLETVWEYTDYDYVVLELPTGIENSEEILRAAEKRYCFLQKSYGEKNIIRQLQQLPQDCEVEIRRIPAQLATSYQDHPADELISDCSLIKNWIKRSEQEEGEYEQADSRDSEAEGNGAYGCVPGYGGR